MKKQSGAGYSMGSQISPGMVNNYAQVVVHGTPLIPDCLAAAKTDTMGFSGPRGLPGLSGGAKKSRRAKKSKRRANTRRQKGGRYGFDLSQPVPPSAGPLLGGIPPVTRIAPESSSTTANPLNVAPKQAGGAYLTSTDTPALFSPTAGYDNRPSTWVSSVGAPVQIQIPYEARAANPACVKTGGARRGTKRTIRRRRQ